MKSILHKNYPFTEELCKNKCIPSQSMIGSNKKSNCSVGYEIPCMTCKRKGITKVYAGESSRNEYVRGSEHLRGLQNKDPKNPPYKLELLDHPKEEAESI